MATPKAVAEELVQIGEQLGRLADQVLFLELAPTKEEFQVGDLVVMLRNYGTVGPKNGTVGVVRAAPDFGGSYTVEFADFTGHDGGIDGKKHCWYVGAGQDELGPANKETK